VHEERLEYKHRIRDVREGPDGLLYLLTDSPRGEVLSVAPSH
jgi:glucose/arabinose dehydrogenase